MLLERQQSVTQQQQKRLARKIHDDISQKMTLLSLQLSLAATEDAPPEDWSRSCQQWSNLVMELGQSIREIITELQPRIVDQQGLTGALRWLAQTFTKSICCTVVAPAEEISLPPFVANELLGICREIISDLLIPGKAPRVSIELENRDGIVELRLHACQTGIDHDLITELSLEGFAIRQRLQCFGGTVELDCSDGHCSIVTFQIPTNQMAACALA